MPVFVMLLQQKRLISFPLRSTERVQEVFALVLSLRIMILLWQERPAPPKCLDKKTGTSKFIGVYPLSENFPKIYEFYIKLMFLRSRKDHQTKCSLPESFPRDFGYFKQFVTTDLHGTRNYIYTTKSSCFFSWKEEGLLQWHLCVNSLDQILQCTWILYSPNLNLNIFLGFSFHGHQWG